MADRWLIAVVLCGLAGCATEIPRYAVQGSPPMTRAEAERTHASRPFLMFDTAEGVTPPKALVTPLPHDPRSAVSAEREAQVTVAFRIEPDGTVADASVVGSAPARFAAVALDAVRRWTFEPARKDGTPVRMQAMQTFWFSPDR